jgi:Fe2+ or Zn2+ uptake regulation protein
MDFKKVLRANNLKVTPKRLAIIKLLEKEKRCLSPREIWEILNIRFLKIGLPSVYRILQEFHSLRLLEVFVSSDTQINYFYCKQDAPEKLHHFVCTHCKRVDSVENKQFPLIQENMKANFNVKIAHHYQLTTGLCRNCK